MTAASARKRNHSRLRHSSRNLPLKLSLVPFCQGFPGSMSAVPMPVSAILSRIAWLPNSGPLSERRKRGAPWILTSRVRTSSTRRDRIEPATSIARHWWVTSSDDRQAFDLLSGSGGVEHEVVGPHGVGVRRRQRTRPGRGNPSPRTPARQLQTGLLPQSMSEMDAQFVTLATQEDADAAVAITRIDDRHRLHGSEYRSVP